MRVGVIFLLVLLAMAFVEAHAAREVSLLKDNLQIKSTERFKNAWYDQDICVVIAMVLESF